MMPSDQKVWAPVVGWEGLYSVSTDGEVLSCRTGKIMRPSWTGKNGNRRATIHLYRDGEVTAKTVYHMVLEAFVGPRPSGKVGCHRDDNKENNTLGNLYWGTMHENAVDRARNGRHKLSHSQRVEVKARKNAGERNADLALEFGVSRSHVSSICNGRVRTMMIFGEEQNA